MRPLSIRLKGYKGIKLGVLAREEVFIDLTVLPEGLIALCGPNGAGKTTIFDNLHPYRVMPFRASDGLFDCVYGQGEKELYWEHGGKVYRSFFKMNAKGRSMEAFLYEQAADGSWSIVVDGRNEEYDQRVEDVLMPEKLFFLAEFRSQSAESFLSLKKSELKALFEKLLGLQHLLEKSQKAKVQKQELETEIAARQREAGALLQSAEAIVVGFPDPAALPEAEKAALEIEVKIGELVAKHNEVVLQLNGITGKEDAIRQAYEEKKAHYLKNKEGISRRREAVIKKSSEYQAIAARRDNIMGAAGKLADVQARIQAEAALIARRSELSERVAAENAELSRLAEIDTKDNREKAALATKLNTLRGQLSIAEKQAQVLDEVSCSEEEKQSCKLLANALEYRRQIPSLKEQIGGLENDMADMENHLARLREDIDAAKARASRLQEEAAALPKAASQALRDEEASLHALAGQLQVLEMVDRELASLKAEIDECAEMDDENDGMIEAEKIAARGKLQAFSEQLAALSASAQKTIAMKEPLDARLRDASARVEDLRIKERAAREQEKTKQDLLARAETIELGVLPMKRDYAQWAFIEKALGREGIIAYELELASPLVSEIANTLLLKMGGRFAIRFDTLRPKAGKKNEYIEVFDIKVLDTMTGEEKSLTDLSGGERIWVDEALARAIGIYLSRSTNLNIDSVFSDERDGALDNDGKKVEFFTMKREVLELGGYKREFFISHAPEALDYADAVINIQKGGVFIDLKNGSGDETSQNFRDVIDEASAPRVKERKPRSSKKKTAAAQGETVDPEAEATQGPTP